MASAPQIVLHDPLWLLALLSLPVAFGLRMFISRAVVFLVPYAAAWHPVDSVSVRRWRDWVVLVGLAAVVFALARPQRLTVVREVKSSGYDIMLAIDLSASMQAEDYYDREGRGINRLRAIKPVIEAFIKLRPNDRIGAVVFSGRAYTLAPLSFDHPWLAERVGKLKAGALEEGTALGDGLALAISRLNLPGRMKEGKRAGAFVVLLTDGASNGGEFTPSQAARLAREQGIPVHTIGIGQDGWVRMPKIDAKGDKDFEMVPSDLDQETLWLVAQATGGGYYRAYDSRAVNEIFKAIDASQKIEYSVRSHQVVNELFYWAAGPGMLLMAAAGFGGRWVERQAVKTKESMSVAGYWLVRQSLIHLSGGTWRLAPLPVGKAS